MTGARHLRRAAAPLAALLVSTASVAQTNPPAPAAPVAPAAGAPSAQTLVNQEAQEKGVFQFDFGVPSSPSLNLLGQPEDKVTVVNGLKPFIIQLPRILGADSQDGQSVGLDFSPAWLLGDASQHTYGNYVRQDAHLYRILNRTHIGLALYEGVANSDPARARSSRIAFGLSTSLLDTSDPLMARVPGETLSAWQTCLNLGQDALQTELNRVTVSDGGARARVEAEINALGDQRREIDRRIAQLEQAGSPANSEARIAANHDRELIQARIAELDLQHAALAQTTRSAQQASFARSEAAQIIPRCAREANLVARYGASFGLGIGALWNGDPGKVRNLSQSGWVLWAAFRHPIGIRFDRNADHALRASGYWMIGFSGRASMDEIVATNDATTPLVRANVFDGWGGIEYLSSASRLSLQVGYQVRDTNGALASFDRHRLRYFASFSQRLGNENSGMWVRVGYGHVRSSDDDDAAFSVSLLFAPPSAANIFGTN